MKQARKEVVGDKISAWLQERGTWTEEVKADEGPQKQDEILTFTLKKKKKETIKEFNSS